MTKSHQIKIYPTRSQEKLLKQSCGVARFTYNWALNKWSEDYRNGIKQSAYSLVKHLNSIKKKDFPTKLCHKARNLKTYNLGRSTLLLSTSDRFISNAYAGLPRTLRSNSKNSITDYPSKRSFSIYSSINFAGCHMDAITGRYRCF